MKLLVGDHGPRELLEILIAGADPFHPMRKPIQQGRGRRERTRRRLQKIVDHAQEILSEPMSLAGAIRLSRSLDRRPHVLTVPIEHRQRNAMRPCVRRQATPRRLVQARIHNAQGRGGEKLSIASLIGVGHTQHAPGQEMVRVTIGGIGDNQPGLWFGRDPEATDDVRFGLIVRDEGRPDGSVNRNAARPQEALHDLGGGERHMRRDGARAAPPGQRRIPLDSEVLDQARGRQSQIGRRSRP
ncbi:hypothetical protein D3C73_418530 [compost metagenome]